MDAFRAAAISGVPVLTTVSHAMIETRHRLAGGLSELLPPEPGSPMPGVGRPAQGLAYTPPARQFRPLGLRAPGLALLGSGDER